MFEFIFVPHVIFVRLFIPFFRYFSVLIQSTSRSQFFFVVYFYGSHPLTSIWPHPRCDFGLEEGEY